jgi:hypothetical protein
VKTAMGIEDPADAEFRIRSGKESDDLLLKPNFASVISVDERGMGLERLLSVPAGIEPNGD